MKLRLSVLWTFFFLLIISFKSAFALGNDSTKYYVSLMYSTDLSDTFGGGDVFSGEVALNRTWYGGKIEFGHFHSQSFFVFKVPYEEINMTLEINVPEMAIMKYGSLSGFVRPIDKKWITCDFLLGAVIGKSKSMLLESIDYEYSIDEGSFKYVFTDYYLYEANHFGFQAGVDITFWIKKSIGLQLNARLHDLSNGGSFLLIGTGISLKIK